MLDTANLVILCVSWEHLVLPFRLNGETKPFGRALEIFVSLTAGTVFDLKIEYETTAESSGLQWLAPSLTEGKVHPYVFSQFQAIHARSFVPCQDSPGAKVTYGARIRVPKSVPLIALMSALSTGKEELSSEMVYHFEQTVAIPTYLIAIVIGNLAGRALGPLTTVWCEPEKLEACAFEFAQVGEFMRHADEVTDYPYRKIGWGKYDILVLPQAFPYGGMENVGLTFVTPSLLAGDRSMVGVIIHELSHSWFGNLLTNHTWEDFSMNEGFCVWLERKIIGRIEGTARRDMEIIEHDAALRQSLDGMLSTPAALSLVHQLDRVDPDDYFSSIPYEKGSQFLLWLERAIVQDESTFERFIQFWIKKKAYGTVTWVQFKDTFIDYFSKDVEIAARLKDIAWDTWLYDRDPKGCPVDVLSLCDHSLVTAATTLASTWLDHKEANCSNADMQGWVPQAKCLFLDKLLAAPVTALSVESLARMDELYGFSAIKHGDVRLKWLSLGLRLKYEPSFAAAQDMLLHIGRMKYVRPLFKGLFAWDWGRTIQFFKENASIYHPICFKMVSRDLGLL